MNQDIAVLAKKAVEYSQLPLAELDKRGWEAMLFVGSIYASATPAGVALAKKDIETRWGPALALDGPLALLHARWHLRTDDAKPPAVAKALASALDNPARTLSARLAVLSKIPKDEQAPLTDLVRALSADAFRGATGEAKMTYVDAMRGLSPKWNESPWLTVLPREGEGPPLQILLDGQGIGANDGSLFDQDPSDDPFLIDAVRNWNVDWLRDNPLALAYQGLNDATNVALDAGAGALKGAGDIAKAIAALIKWSPYILAGMAVTGVASVAMITGVRALRAGGAK